MTADHGATADPKSPIHVVTIAAANYLARVRVLARSVFRQHPDAIFEVCVVDDVLGAVDPALEGFGVIRLGELPMPLSQLRAMALIYDVMEFSTAIKPWVIDAARRRAPMPVLYLDPDIEVFGPLDELAELSERHGIVLTPHVLTPIPRDGRGPAEPIILRSGIYNLGFIGIGTAPELDGFLDFWKERLKTDAVSDPDNGLFTDQRWIDFVPGLYPHHIHRDRGCNVAYWNVHERPIVRDGDCITAGGSPLKFFHYSGFDVQRPYWLSRHAGPLPRVLLSEHPVLQDLCLAYAARVIEASGDVADGYQWDILPNGVAVDSRIRSLYRHAVKRAEAGEGPLPPDLTDPGGLATLMDWLLEPVTPRQLPRYVEALVAERPDVARAFPGLDSGQFEPFLSWLNASAARESRVSPRLVAAVTRSLRRRGRVGKAAPESPHQAAVEVVGLFRAESGVGEAARRTAAALAAAGVRHRTTGWYSPCDHRLEARFVEGTEGVSAVDCDVAVLHVNADVLVPLVRELGHELAEGQYRVGMWFWELEEFPRSLCGAFDHVDEVWVATRFQQSAIGAVSPKPVIHLPIPLTAPEVEPGLERRHLGLPDGLLFLFMFDLLSVFERKNPIDLIEAYCQAFSPGDGAQLVIKTINGHLRLDDLERLRHACRGRPDVTVRDEYMTAGRIGALIESADCYVSLHRSEGLGLTVAEALALGKPVVATAYSGICDFFGERNGFPVDYVLTPVGPGADPYEPDAKWAQPDIEAAAEAMRLVADDPALAAVRGRQARLDLESRFSPAACGALMARRLAEIREAGR